MFSKKKACRLLRSPQQARALRPKTCDCSPHIEESRGPLGPKSPKSLKKVFPQKNSRRLELSISKNIPHGRLGQGPGSVVPRFPAGLPFPVPEILEFAAFRDSGKVFQQFSRDFPGVFLENPRTDPGNSHSLLEFSDSRPGVSKKRSCSLKSCHENPDPPTLAFLNFLPFSLRRFPCFLCVLLCPQSPRAKFLRNFSKTSPKNAAKFWRNVSQIFVLQFPGKMAAKNFTKNPRHFPQRTKLSSFYCCNSGGLGVQAFYYLFQGLQGFSGKKTRSKGWRVGNLFELHSYSFGVLQRYSSTIQEDSECF